MEQVPLTVENLETGGQTGSLVGRYPASKRLFDLAFSVAALTVSWPLILAGAVAVKLTSAGPAFYRARRVGQGGRPFTMLKLRTMFPGTDSLDRRVTAADDDRVTPVGRVLRRLKVEELPQLWNVVRGEMSVVGPRPEDWEIFQRYYTPEQRRIAAGRPGIVSPVDLNWYPDLTYHDPPPDGVSAQEWYVQRHLPLQVAEGLQYLEQQNLWLDFVIVVRTVLSVTIYSVLKAPKRPLPDDYQVSRAKWSSGID